MTREFRATPDTLQVGSETSNAVGVVPGTLRTAGPEDEVLKVTRAWPDGDRSRGRILLEARDGQGRVRAGRLHLADETNTVERTEVAQWAQDPRLPDLAEAATTGELLVHRWGKRAVVRHAGSYSKILRIGREDELAERTRVGADLARQAGLVAPNVQEVGPGRVELSILPGVTLHRASEFDLKTWEEIWLTWAHCWPRFVSRDGEALPRRTPAHEAATTAEWIDRAIAFGAIDPAYVRSGSAVLEPALARLEADLTAAAPDLVISHRDLHDQQILADSETGRLGLLDLDTACRAEPALDLGNLAVHAILRVEQGIWSTDHRSIVLAVVRDTARELAVPADRLDAAVRAAGLRLAGLYAFRPRYRGLAHRWATEWSVPEHHPLSRWVD